MVRLSGKKRGKVFRDKKSAKKQKKAVETLQKISNPRHPFRTEKKKVPLVAQIPKDQEIKNRINTNNSNDNDNIIINKGPLSKKELRLRKREKNSKKSQGDLRVELNYFFSDSIKNKPRKEQIAYADNVIKKMKGKILELIRSPDMSKIMQTAIKYGSSEALLSIARELKGHFIELSTDINASISVKRLLEYGKEPVRKIIGNELIRQFSRLLTHRLAATIVDYAIITVGDEVIKRRALQYILSPKHKTMLQYEDDNTDINSNNNNNDDTKNENSTVDKTNDEGINDFLEMDKDENKNANGSVNKKKGNNTKNEKPKKLPKNIEQIIKSANMTEKNHLLKNMEEFLTLGLEKDLSSTGIYEIILYEYLRHCDENEFESMFELVLPHMMNLQNILEGVKGIILGLSYAKSNNAPKFRKEILKLIKPHVLSMSCDKSSYLLIIRCLDVVDDTKMLNKVIIQNIIYHLDTLCYHDFGRLVLLHLLTPRNSKYFRPDFFEICPQPLIQSEIEQLKSNESNGDNDNNNNINNKWKYIPTSKKSHYTRYQELLNYLLPSLINYIETNTKKLLMDGIGGIIVIEVLKLLLNKHDEHTFYKNNNLFDNNVNININDFIDNMINTILDNKGREMSATPELPDINKIYKKYGGKQKIYDLKKILNSNNNPIIQSSENILKQKYSQNNDNNNDNNNEDNNEANNEANNDNNNLENHNPATTDNNDDDNDGKNDINILPLDEEEIKKHEEKIQKENEKIEKEISDYTAKIKNEFEKEMLLYQVIKSRHKDNITKNHDKNTCLMDHRLAHRRIRKMVSLFPEIHEKLLNGIISNNNTTIDDYIKMRSIYILTELYLCGNNNIKKLIIHHIQPILLKYKDDNQPGIKKFIEILST